MLRSGQSPSPANRHSMSTMLRFARDSSALILYLLATNVAPALGQEGVLVAPVGIALGLGFLLLKQLTDPIIHGMFEPRPPSEEIMKLIFTVVDDLVARRAAEAAVP